MQDSSGKHLSIGNCVRWRNGGNYTVYGYGNEEDDDIALRFDEDGSIHYARQSEVLLVTLAMVANGLQALVTRLDEHGILD